MIFASDNWHGPAPEIVAAMTEAATGIRPAYGGDEASTGLKARFEDVFETELEVFPVATGTAANGLALAAVTPAHAGVLCHGQAHILSDECGTVEFFTGGARLIPLEGALAKLDRAGLVTALADHGGRPARAMPPAAISITQLSEAGTAYALDEIAAIAGLAHEAGLKLHMDGARLANAIAGLGCSPADATWRAGVDVLSFGATKNGGMNCDAVVVFGACDAGRIDYLRKRAGHVYSKARFAACQLAAYLEDGLWLRLAAQANARAAQLAAGLDASKAARLAWPPAGNEVFAVFAHDVDTALKQAGAVYHPWPGAAAARDAGAKEGEVVARLVVSFATGEDEIERFLDVLNSMC